MTGRTPDSELLGVLSGFAHVVTIRAGQAAVVRIGGAGEYVRYPLHGGLLGRMACATLTRQSAIALPLLPVAGSAGYRRMKRVEGKRRIAVVRKHQAAASPACLRVAGTTGEAHLTRVGIGVAGLAILTQAGKSRVRESAAASGDTMALVASHVRVLASEGERGIGPVGRHQPAAVPAVFTVALLTGFRKLAAVRIAVTERAIGRQMNRFHPGKPPRLERGLVACITLQTGVVPSDRRLPVVRRLVTGQALHLVLSAVNGVQV